MSWLAKRLALLFYLIASLLILLVAVASKLNVVTILKRIFIGGLIFSILGAVIGQLISYNVYKNKSKKSFDSKQTVTESKSDTSQSSSKPEENDIESLDFNKVDKETENIVNLAQEAPDKMADMVKNMSQEE